MNPTVKIYTIVALALLIMAGRADYMAWEGREVYHSSCEVSPNPVRYVGHSGKVSVRRWWYLDTITGQKIMASKAQHEACESVKVLMSSELEVLKAERLRDVKNNWYLAIAGWLVLMFLTMWLRGKHHSWKREQEGIRAQREREREAQRREEERAIQEKINMSNRLRSKRANEERARRKAERGAILEARRLANLERKRSN